MTVQTFQLQHVFSNTERVERLREKVLTTKPFVCVERARLITEAYKNSEGRDAPIRKALALKHQLENMTIYINDGELIVGNNSSGPRGSVVAPEYGANWLSRELNDPEKAPDKRNQDRHILPDEVKTELMEEIIPYWLGKTVEDRVVELVPPMILEHGIASMGKTNTTPVAPEIYMRNGIGHVVVDYEKLLALGFAGLRIEAERKSEELEYSSAEGVQKIIYYRSIAIAHRAVQEWIKRYARLAKEKASSCSDRARSKELERISEDCFFISENPPRTFRQAIQSVFFAQLILFGLEQNCTAVSPGRFDQYMFPFYARDLNNGEITRQESLELIECLFIKLSEMSILWDFDSASYWSGFSMTLCLLVGGVDEDGNDATNDLSYLIIEADTNTGLLQPELAVRVHSGSPRELLIEALKEVKLGRGKPKFFMDNAAIAMIRNTDVSLREARNYAVVGCVELTPSGNTAAYTGAVFINLAKCLELALNDGQCFITGEYIGERTGKPEHFKEYHDLILAFEKQVSYAVRNSVQVMNAILVYQARLFPCPFTSSLIDGCMKKGLDFTEGGAEHNFVGVTGVGLPNVANSLAALKSYIYSSKKMGLDKFVSILKKDFENHEDFRLELWNKVPKYGNDDESVDCIAREMGQFYCREVSAHTGSFGHRFRPGLFAVSINVPFGLVTGATAEGRKAGRPLADGGISPVAGSERNGILGAIKSATRIDHVLAANGTLLNVRLSPAVFETEETLMKMASLLRSYHDLGGYHIQFNVIRDDVLRKAQKKPEEYRGLMVRVAGYSAYFTELNPEVQEDIISRTMHDGL
jgi:pyruvate formate-lyase/glycerol dehydratase family glycyl radical enzyme